MDASTQTGARTTHRDRLPSSSRYQLLVKIASGGMASVYVGRLTGAVGFQRLVAIKRAHAHLIEDSGFRRSFIAEARLASKIHHANVVGVQDVEELEGELLLIMEYIEGASLFELGSLSRAPERLLSPPLAIRILLDACEGLQAAHDLLDDDGEPLGLVHRDVSPQNILVGIDGVCRIADFGIAKSAYPASANTATGALKGKVSYMAPEYIESGSVDVRSDVFALGVVAWETLTRQRLFRGANELETLQLLSSAAAPAPSSVAPWLDRDLDEVVLRALEKDPSTRWQSARAFGEALHDIAQGGDKVATRADVADHVRSIVYDTLEARRALIRASAKDAAHAQGPRRMPSAVSVPHPLHDAVDDDPRTTATLHESPDAKASRTPPTRTGVERRQAAVALGPSRRLRPRWRATAVAVTTIVLVGGVAALMMRSPTSDVGSADSVAPPSIGSADRPSVESTQPPLSPDVPMAESSPAESSAEAPSVAPRPLAPPTDRGTVRAPAGDGGRKSATAAVPASPLPPPAAPATAPANPYGQHRQP